MIAIALYIGYKAFLASGWQKRRAWYAGALVPAYEG